MYIRSATLKNIRGFTDLAVSFAPADPKGPRQTLILGMNGTCKTTLLRALAIGVCDLADAGGLLALAPGQLVTEGKSEAQIVVEVGAAGEESGAERITTLIKSRNGWDFLDPEISREVPTEISQSLVCGYGVGRSTSGTERQRERYRIFDTVASLFEYDRALASGELTLRRLQDFLGKAAYEKTLRVVKRALGLRPRDKLLLPKSGGVVASGSTIGKEIPLDALADGYRMTFLWIMDLYSNALWADAITSEGEVEGTVLIDEVDQHLHPSLQASLYGRLAELFPKLQVIGTTHSPLVALGVPPEALIVLRREGRRVLAGAELPDYSGYSAEDMLTDPAIFDTEPYSPAISRKLALYRKLMGKPERTAREKAELSRVASELSRLQLPEVHRDRTAHRLEQLLGKLNL